MVDMFYVTQFIYHNVYCNHMFIFLCFVLPANIDLFEIIVLDEI